MATNGLVVMAPTSIAYSGTSASINADGSVSFSAVTSLSLNGVFTSSYDNYMVTFRHSSTGNGSILARYRVGGVDSSTGGYYTDQIIDADTGSITATRFTGNDFHRWGVTSTVQRSGDTVYVFGPALTQPTASRSVGAGARSSASIGDRAGTHSQSVAYDGFTIPISGTISGLVTVFGFNQ